MKWIKDQVQHTVSGDFEESKSTKQTKKPALISFSACWNDNTNDLFGVFAFVSICLNKGFLIPRPHFLVSLQS